MTNPDNKAVVRHFIDVWQSGSLDMLDAVVDRNYVGHALGGERDLEGLRDRMQAFLSVMPDVVFHIEVQLAEDDLVATRLTARGTHAASGQPTTLLGLNLSRVRDGKIVETWTAWETLE